MTETAVRELKINKRYAGKPCAWCGDELLIGDDGAICEACESSHHARCWQQHSGCGLSSCVNTPLPDLGLPGQLRRLRSDEKTCRHCDKIIYMNADICRHCGQIVTADGVYRGEQTIAPEAKLSLMYSIVGLFCCLGLVLGPMGFKNGMDAKKAIAADPRLRGRSMAIGGQVIGVIDIVLWLGTLVLSPPAMSNQMAYWAGYLAIPFLAFVGLVFFLRWRLSRP